MRNYLSSQGVVFCVALLCALVSASTAKAQLQFSSTTIRAGEVLCGAPLAHRFMMVNKSNAPIDIVGTRTTCGCLTPKIERQVLQPGEEGSVLLEINTLSQPAATHDWSCKLYHRENGQLKETALHIVATIVAEISVEPAALVISSSSAVHHALTFTDTRPQPLTIAGVDCTSKNVQLQVGKMEKNANGHWEAKIKFELKDTLPEGTHQEAIRIYTKDPTYPELKIPLTLIKENPKKVAAFPENVQIRGVVGKVLPSRIVVLRNTSQDPIEIESIQADHPAIHCSWANGPENNATLKVTIDPQPAKQPLAGRLQIRLSQPSEEVLVIPVECVVE